MYDIVHSVHQLVKRIYYFFRARSRERSTKQPRHVCIRGAAAAGRPGAHDLAGVAPRWSSLGGARWGDPRAKSWLCLALVARLPDAHLNGGSE